MMNLDNLRCMSMILIGAHQSTQKLLWRFAKRQRSRWIKRELLIHHSDLFLAMIILVPKGSRNQVFRFSIESIIAPHVVWIA